jgi:drug/metabolite transporter (DMT)-like permease
MFVLMVVSGHRMPRGRALAGAALYGLLAFGGAFAFAFYALVELEAGFGQILLSIVPLVTLLLAAIQRIERSRGVALVGALVSLAGVVTMSGLSLQGSLPLTSVLAGVGSAVCFAQASLTIKRFPELHPIVVNAVGMAAGAVFLAAVTVIAGNEVVLPAQSDTWWAFAYMVLVGSIAVFSIYVALLERWEASRANYGFVVIPIITVLVSAWLLDEPITIGLVFGGALVLAGVYLGALRQPTTTRT